MEVLVDLDDVVVGVGEGVGEGEGEVEGEVEGEESPFVCFSAPII